VRTTHKGYEKIYVPPPPNVAVLPSERIVPVEEFPEAVRVCFDGVTKALNRVQSRVYPAAFGRSSNLLVRHDIWGWSLLFIYSPSCIFGSLWSGLSIISDLWSWRICAAFRMLIDANVPSSSAIYRFCLRPVFFISPPPPYPFSPPPPPSLQVCAPTGAGKTEIAMMAVLREVCLHIRGGVVQTNEFKVPPPLPQ
jgi:hypothetical protein